MTHGGLHPWVGVPVSDGTISTGGVLVGTLRRELQSLALTPSPCPSRHRAKEVPQPSTGEVEVVVYGFGQLCQDANDWLAYLRDVDRSPTRSARTSCDTSHADCSRYRAMVGNGLPPDGSRPGKGVAPSTKGAPAGQGPQLRTPAHDGTTPKSGRRAPGLEIIVNEQTFGQVEPP